MSGENSYESDVSESWSVIDLNLNEQAVESHLAESTEVLLSSSSREDLPTSNKTPELVDVSSSGTVVSYLPTVSEVGDCDVRSSDEKNESSDDESIEVLDVEESHRDSHDSQYLTDNSKSDKLDCHEITELEINSCSAVIRRRRKKRKLSESSSNSLLDDSLSSSDSVDSYNPDCDLRVELYKTKDLSMHRHCQNTLRSTAFSLCLGVLFAGIACLVIGHILGGHDSSETAANDLLDALKKLQLKNAELQSRLSSINKDFMSKTVLHTAKHESYGEEDGENYCTRREASMASFKEKMTKEEAESDLELAKSMTKLSSAEWLNNFQNLGVENVEPEGTKLRQLEESSAKIASVLQKIISSLSSSQENLESLYQRLFKLKTKLNKQLDKIFTASKSRHETVADWMQPWSEKSRNMGRPITLYKFPQPEEYYKASGIGERKKEEKEETEAADKSIPKEAPPPKSEAHDGSHDTLKKLENNNIEKRRVKVKKGEGKERGRRMEAAAQERGPHHPRGNDGSGNRQRRGKTVESNRRNETLNFTKYKKSWNNNTEYGGSRRGRPKKATKEKYKRKEKEKTNGNHLNEERHFPQYQGHTEDIQRSRKRNFFGKLKEKFSNRTGQWVFKMANGRERIRKDETLGDWQFDRARARKEFRADFSNLNHGTWQFDRARARKELRNDFSNLNHGDR